MTSPFFLPGMTLETPTGQIAAILFVPKTTGLGAPGHAQSIVAATKLATKFSLLQRSWQRSSRCCNEVGNEVFRCCAEVLLLRRSTQPGCGRPLFSRSQPTYFFRPRHPQIDVFFVRVTGGIVTSSERPTSTVPSGTPKEKHAGAEEPLASG